MSETNTKIYAATWMLPITDAPIRDGALAVEGTRIVRVGTRSQIVAEFPHGEIQEYKDHIILPGLTNAHTHLELTAMRGFLDSTEHDFFAWLKKLTVARLERMTADDLYVSAAWGAIEAVRSGVTSIGDATDSGLSVLRAVQDVGLRAVIFQEAFGIDGRVANEQLVKLQEKVDRLREREIALARIGVSPHAPYTVSGKLIKLIARYATNEHLPVMMHAAESASERELLLEGAGAFSEGLKRRGIAWHAPRASTVRYLESCGLLEAKPLLAHCITVDDADIEIIKRADASVAHCPKSNAKLGHGRAPFAKFIEREIRVGLGSDSVASNNTCDMLEEARFAVLMSRAGREEDENASHWIDADEALRAATYGGAQALRSEHETGALTENYAADFIVVALNEPAQLPVYEPESALAFASSGRDVKLTVIDGREIFKNGTVQTIDEREVRARVAQVARKLSQ